MATTTIARSGQESTTEPQPGYVFRGLGLFELHAEEIMRGYLGSGRWLIPSGSEVGRYYVVRVGIRRSSTCECVGYERHGHCSHLVAAERVARRSAVCDCCGIRAWWSELQEVTEEDGLLAWFPSDRLCDGCRPGHWA